MMSEDQTNENPSISPLKDRYLIAFMGVSPNHALRIIRESLHDNGFVVLNGWIRYDAIIVEKGGNKNRILLYKHFGKVWLFLFGLCSYNLAFRWSKSQTAKAGQEIRYANLEIPCCTFSLLLIRIFRILGMSNLNIKCCITQSKWK